MIKFTNVYKKYEDFLLEDISFKLNSKECLGIVGPSGSGKSTIINLALGFEKADKGTIENTFKSISCVFQENRLVETASVKDNILAVKQNNDGLRILKELEIENFNQKSKNLSGGMKRRVAIARALAYDGELLILDEAFNGLDKKMKIKTINIIKKYTKNKSIILISHNLEDFNLFEIENFISTQ